MKIALDPYMFREVTTLESLPGVVADLGYEWIELSPREDFTPFFTHPRPECVLAPAPGTVSDATPARAPAVTAHDFLRERLQAISA